MSKMVAVDEKKRDGMVQQNDQVTLAFHGGDVYDGVPLAHCSKKSPLDVVFYLFLFTYIPLCFTKCVCQRFFFFFDIVFYA